MEKRCKYCGEPITQTAGKREKKYCSDQCRSKYWSSPQCAEYVEARHERRCEKCGVAFHSYSDQKYCSHECYIAARFGLTSGAEEAEWVLLKRMEEEAPEAVFAEEAEVVFREMDEPLSMIPVRVADGNEKLKPKRVYLFAGRYKFHGKYDHFAGLIPLAQQKSPRDGDVFVYCNMQRTQLSVLQWQGDGFALFFKRTEYGRYPWPFSVGPKLIEIRPMDLRLLLEMPCLLHRISGQQVE